jgi:hypothetical protein
MAGRGHCMTLYILKRDGSQFEKVWQSYENLCTESIFGAAKSQAMPDGRIIVRFREHSRTFDPEKEQAPQCGFKTTMDPAKKTLYGDKLVQGNPVSERTQVLINLDSDNRVATVTVSTGLIGP